MAFFENIKTLTYNTGADLSAKQYFFVKLSAGEAVLATDGSDAIGILLNEPGDDQSATVALVDAGGKCKVIAGAAIAQDAYVSSNSAGKAITAGTSDVILGQALEAATAGDQVITIALGHRGVGVVNGGYS